MYLVCVLCTPLYFILQKLTCQNPLLSVMICTNKPGPFFPGLSVTLEIVVEWGRERGNIKSPSLLVGHLSSPISHSVTEQQIQFNYRTINLPEGQRDPDTEVKWKPNLSLSLTHLLEKSFRYRESGEWGWTRETKRERER